MKRTTAMSGILLAAVAAAASAGPGSGHGRCTGQTQACVDHLAKDLKGRGWVGIQMQGNDDGTITLAEVVSGSPAEKAGLKKGDVLVSVEGKAFGKASDEEMAQVHQTMKPGKVITYQVSRDGKERDVKVELGQMPDHVQCQIVGAHLLENHVSADGTATAHGKLKELTVEEVAQLVQAGKVHVYDANPQVVRDKFGVIPGATLLTSAAKYEVSSLPRDKNAKLVFYCANTKCTASDAAAERAIEAGYENVTVLRAGIAGWKDAGQKTASAPTS